MKNKINFGQIKNFIKNLPGALKSLSVKIKEIPHSGKYIFLALFSLVLFLIITFPYDYLIKKKIYELEGKSFRTIDISGFDFSLFGETYFDSLSLVLNNGNEVYCKHSIINIALNPLTVYLNNKIKADYQFDSFRYITKDYEFLFNINGNVDLVLDKKSRLPENGLIKIIISDSNITLNNISIPGPMGQLPLKIDTINIQSGNIDARVNNGILNFNNFKLTGNDITCDISGSVELIAGSKIDLTINIDSESAVLDQYKDILSSFIRNNIFSLRIKGTTNKPELTVNNTGKNEN